MRRVVPNAWTRSFGSRVAGRWWRRVRCSIRAEGDARVDEGDGLSTDHDPLGVLRAAVKLVAAMALTDCADAAIAKDLVRLRRSMDRLDGVFAHWSVTAQGRGLGLADGHSSMPAWMGWKTGIRRTVMNHSMRVAEVAELLPESGAAWRNGEISTGAMEAIASARVAGHDEKLAVCEAEFLKLARRGEHPALRKAVAHFRNLAQGDGTEPADCNGLTLSPILGGRTAVTGELCGADAETVQAALAAFMDPPLEGDDRTPAQRRADALVRICEVALARGVSASRAKAHVTVVVDWETLLDDVLGRADGMFTGPMHRREIERLLCDCHVSRVVMGPGSKPLDVGRQGQSWPAPIRRGIVARDRGCQWPGCEIPAAWCERAPLRALDPRWAHEYCQRIPAVRAPSSVPPRTSGLDGDVRRSGPTRVPARWSRAAPPSMGGGTRNRPAGDIARPRDPSRTDARVAASRSARTRTLERNDPGG